MTKEEIQEMMRKIKENDQDKFIDKLLDQVSNLCEKANRKSYEPTTHEREAFSQIVAIVDDMKGWF